MKSSTRALITLVVFIALCFSLLFWSIQNQKAEAQKLESKIVRQLSADDVKTILASEAQGNPQQLAALASAPEQRKEILQSLRQLLAQAAEARRLGIADDPTVQSQLELQKKVIVARAYDEQQNQGQPAPPFASITKEEVDKFYQEPAHAAEFQKAIDSQISALKAAGQQVPKLEGETLNKAKEAYAKLSLAYEKAKAANFEDKRDVQLQVKLQEALLLAREYSQKNLAKQVEPTKEEVAAYLAQHPEYDPAKQREKAESVLQRAKSGEDFAALANQYSEDPGNKDPQTGQPKGGLYENIQQGSFVPEFEAAALALEKGQITPNLVQTQYGYHIIKLEDKKTEKGKDGKDTTSFSVRHILFQTQFPAPNNNPYGPPRFMKGEEIAKNTLGQEKRKKLIDEVVERNNIVLPDDFTVDVPPGAENASPQFPGLPTDEPAPAKGNPTAGQSRGKEALKKK